MDLKELRELRIDAKMSMEVLSKKSGVHRDTVSSVEKGLGSPSFAVVQKIVEGLGYEIRLLLKREV